MVEARMTSPDLLRKILDAIRELVEEANIECNESGLQLQAMDYAHVALVSMMLNDSAFDPYKCSEQTMLGININTALKILKCAGSSDTLTLKTSEDSQELKFMFESVDSDRVFEFSMALMDIDGDHLSIPESEPDASVAMSSAQFQRVCRDLTQFGETVKIGVNKKSVSFTIVGDSGRGTLTLESVRGDKGDQNVTITCQEPIEVSFPLKYLCFFAKAAPIAPTVKICISNERPLVAEFELEDGAGFIKYYLAPKIDVDEAEEE